jgi:2-dehydropantoate 2-reductase
MKDSEMIRIIKKVYLSGLGAIGSSYAAKLYETDPELVTVIADRKRIERYYEHGVLVNGKSYSFRYLEQESTGETADLILIAVKQHQLDESIQGIRNFVGEKTIVLSLLNGISSEELVGKEYGMEKMLYSFVVGTDAVREGTNTTFSKLGKIVFGEKNNPEYSEKVLLVKELFDRTGIPYEIPENMLKELWWKFMLNVGINQVSALLKAPYGVFQKNEEARELMEMASREVIQLSEKVGISLNEDDLRKSIEIVNTLGPEGKTSMLQDVEAGRKTEVEIFAGTVAKLGREFGVSTPVNDFLLRAIHILEQTY